MAKDSGIPDNNHLITTDSDISAAAPPVLKAADLMREAVVSVEREAHLAAVAYLMRRAGQTALVVVDETERRTPLAVITDTDVAQAIADGRDPNKVRVSELVHRDPITVSADTPLVRAATVMVSADIRHLPVVAEDRLLGLLDISDVCRALVEMQTAPDGSVTVGRPV
jgi:CBS domain-containing protein